MARNGEPSWNHRSGFLLALAGLMLSTGAVLLLLDPRVTIPQKCPQKISAYPPTIYANFYSLNPINLYLNLLLLVVHVTTLERVPRAPILLFMMKYLPLTAQTVSFATLVLSVPMFMHATVCEESVGFAIGAALVSLLLISILSSILQKLLNSGGFVPGLYALFISAGFLLFFDPLSPFFNKFYHDTVTHKTLTHLLMLFMFFVSFVAFALSITLVILRIGAPSASHAENFVTIALSVALSTTCCWVLGSVSSWQ